MVRPLTTEASCKFGVDTKWCIAAKVDNRFSQYTETDKNEFFFVIKKGAGRGIHNRLAVQITKYGRITVWNAEDRVEDPKILKTLPTEINKIINDRVNILKISDIDCYEKFNTVTSFDFGGELGVFIRTKFDPTKDSFALYTQEISDPSKGLYFVTLEKNDAGESRSIIFNLSFKYENRKYIIYQFRDYCNKNSIELASQFIRNVDDIFFHSQLKSISFFFIFDVRFFDVRFKDLTAEFAEDAE